MRLIIKYQFNELNRNGHPNQALQILTYPVVLNDESFSGSSTRPYSGGFLNVFEGDVSISGSLNENVYAFGTITITGPIENTTGSPIKIIAQQIIVADGVDVPNNFDLIIGLPPGCGDPIGTSTIDLGAYCSGGAYKANSLSIPAQTGGEEAKKEKGFRLSTFPNPFSGQFVVGYNLEQNEDVELLVRDELGRIVFSKAFDENVKGQHFYQIDGSYLPTGVYFLTIQTEWALKTVKLMKHAK